MKQIPIRYQLSDKDLLFMLKTLERSGPALANKARLYRIEAERRGLLKKK